MDIKVLALHNQAHFRHSCNSQQHPELLFS